MKKFIKLIPVFLLFCLTSITVKAQDSTSLCLEELNTDVYEDILTEYYEVETGYAYCSSAVNLTSSVEITEDVSVTILDAYGSNVWRVDTSLDTADSNCTVVELNNNFYYLSAVSNAVFTDEGVTFSTNKLGTYIAGGCFSEEDIENFSAGTSNFSIENNAIWTDESGKAYYAVDAITTWDISKNEDGSVIAYLFDTDADTVGDTVVLDGVGETVGFNAYVYSDTQIYGNGSIFTINHRGFGYKGTSYTYYAAPWTLLAYRDNIKHFYITNTSNVTFGNTAYLFYKLSNLESVDFNNTSFSNVTSMLSMFEGCSTLTSLDLSSFDTSNVTYLGRMFYDCKLLTTLDLSNFNTSSVKDMSSMFRNCSSLTTLNLSNFDTSNVTRMTNMFSGCESLTTLDLSNFNTSNVTDISYMFFYCSSLTTLDLSNFNTVKVTNMSNMFKSCSSLTSLDLSNFNTCNVKYMDSMFYNCKLLTLLDVSNFNTSKVTRMNDMFRGCSSLTALDLSNFNTSNVTNMKYMFSNCSSLTTLDISSLNTSNVTNMEYMFAYCSTLTSLDLSNFNTSNVTNMQNMFDACKALTSLDLSNFNTSGVKYMNYMFKDCSSLISLDISNFDTSNVTAINNMFYYCSSLTSLDISSFDTSNVTTMEYMFRGCNSLTSLDLSNFNTSNVTNMNYMFNGCSSLISLDISSFNMSSVTEYVYMFSNCKALETLKTPSTNSIANITLPITMYTWPDNTPYTTLPVTTGTSLELHDITRDGEWLGAYYSLLDKDGDGVKETVYVFGTFTDTTKIYGPNYSSPKPNYQTYGFYKVLRDHPDITKAIINCSLGERTNIGSLFAGCTQLVSLEFSTNFDTSKVTDMEYMFSRCSSLTSLDINNFNTNNVIAMNGMFGDCSSLTDLDISSFDTSNVKQMYNMFDGCKSLVTLDVSNFNTSNVTTMQRMFFYCNSLTTLDVRNFNTSKVTNMRSMFSGCSAFTSLDLSNFNTSSVTNMSSMFYGCKALTTLDLSNFNTVNVTNMYDMFSNCSSLTTLNISNFNTVNVTSMDSMFRYCSSLTSLNLNNFNTSTVTDMRYMFNGCELLTSLDVSNFDTSKVTNMSSMFENCNALTSLGLSNFNTSNVTDMGFMFRDCSSLATLNISNFDTSKVARMDYMFYNCRDLTSLDLSNFNTSKVTNMKCMFDGCQALTSLDISNFNTINATDMSYMFSNCKSLTTLDLSNFDTSNVTNMSNMFYNCCSLTILDVNNFDTSKATDILSMFRNCNSVTILDLSNFDTSKVTNMGYMFEGCNSLIQLDISSFNMSSVTGTTSMFSGCSALDKVVLPINVGACTINLPKTFYGYAADDTRPDKPQSYTVLPAADASTRLYYISSTKYTAIEALLRDTTNEDYFLGVGHTSFKRENIASVNFITNSTLTPSDAVVDSVYGILDVSLIGDEGVFAYSKASSNEGLYDIYVVTKYDKIYTNANVDGGAKYLFKGLYNCSSITGIEYLDLSRSSTAEGMFSGYALNSIELPSTYYAHSENVDENGNSTSSTYSNNLKEVTNVSFPGAAKLEITITLQTESTSWDWVAIYPGDVTPTDTNYSEATVSNGKLGGSTKTTKSFTYEGDSINILFRTDGSGNKYYGYYAVITAYDADNNVLSTTVDLPKKVLDLSNLNLPSGINATDFLTDCSNLSELVTPSTNPVNNIALPITMYTWPDKTSYTVMPTTSGTSIVLHDSDVVPFILNTAGDLYGTIDATTKVLTITGAGTALDKKLYDAIGFENCAAITGIIFNTNTIESICDEWCKRRIVTINAGENAGQSYELFVNLTGNLVLPSNLITIGKYAFYKCGFTGDLVIPDTVTTIGNYAFTHCSNMTGSLTLGSNLETIGSYAFHNCNGLSGTLTIPNSVTTIGSYAFTSCYELTGELVLPNSITTIEDFTFSSCNGFTKLVIPDSVTTIKEKAFNSCNNILEITIGSGLTSIGSNAFLTYIRSSSTGYSNANTVLNTTNVNAIQYDWLSNRRDVSLRYNLSTSGDLYGDLNITSGLLTVKGTGTNLNRALSNVLQSDEERALLRGISFETQTVEIIGHSWCDNYTGNFDPSTYEPFLYFPNLTGNLVLPSNLKEIKSSAFWWCNQLTGDLVIPEGVTSIGSYAFCACDNMTGTLTLPSTLTTVDRCAFLGSGFTGSLTLPNSLRTVGDNAFSGCHGFTGDIVIPRSMTTIPNGMFGGCVNLNGTLTIPNTVTSIGKEAFSDCAFTGTLTIPSSVTTIGEINTDNHYYIGAFEGCTGFTKLVLNEGVTSIGDNTFSGCTGLSEVKIPDSVTTLGGYVFSDCTNLDTITIGNGITSTDSIRNNIFRLQGGSNKDTFVKTENQVFLDYSWSGDNRNVKFCDIYDLNNAHDLYGCVEKSTGVLYVTGTGKNLDRSLVSTLGKVGADLTGITFVSQTVQSICNDWCGYCLLLVHEDVDTKLPMFKNITGDLILPSSITSLGEYAFNGVKFNGTLELPDGISSIGKYAFSGCEFTGELNIPNNLTTINDGVFTNCKFTGNLNIPNSITSIGKYAFKDCTEFTGDLVIPDTVQSLGTSAFSQCTGFTSLTLGSGITSIPDLCFFECVNLRGDLIIPVNVTSIGNSAFASNKDTTEMFADSNLVISDSVTTINSRAFDRCKFTGNLKLPKDLTSIEEYTFRSNKLTSIEFNNSLLSIGNWAFYNCTELSSLVLNTGLQTIGKYAFSGCVGLRGDLIIPEGVTSIGTSAFSSGSSSNKMFENGILSLPSTLQEINAYTFNYCKFTGTFEAPENLISIGPGAFSYNYFNNIVLNDKLTSIGNYAFKASSKLTADKLIIPNSVTTINNGAFDACYKLKKLYIGNGVTTLGEKVFCLSYATPTKLYTTNEVVKNYDWAGDNRTILPMNTFTFALPQEISLKPKYLNVADAPVFYSAFNMEITGDFEDGSYGTFEGVPSFTISTDSGETRTVTTNVENTTVSEDGTITVPIIFTAPNPTLNEEFSGQFQLPTVLHEVLPFAS